ncbi:MAG: ATP-binding protein [Microcystaceae cyanobacterium]
MADTQLIVPAIRDSLTLISNYIKEIVKQAELDPQKGRNLRRAVDEIATNIIEHGYSHCQQRGTIELAAQLNSSTLMICIKDSGIPFNPTQHPIPDDLSKPLEERKIGGLGIYLAQVSVDQLLYKRVKNYNCNQLIVYRQSSLSVGK